ncbi:MAG: efflux RND transporter periplasmic adaptor subunit [Gemmatimonadetes bacterium]|nr:efflux RND transporter periplasmic adaptor subunit [Gemmatimonadota bacterium]
MKRLALPAILAILAGCRADAAPPAAPAPPAADTAAAAAAAAPSADTVLLGAEALKLGGIRVAPLLRASWHDEWRAPGRLALDPTHTQPLGSLVEGRVVRVLALPGDRVRAGQVLATLHSHEMLDALAARAATQAALARAENELRLATSTLERAERLYAAKATSLAELERARAARIDAEAQRDAAAAEAERAREMVAHLRGSGPTPPGTEPHEVLIRSPIDGVVVSREVQPGQVVVVGAPLLTVSRIGRLLLVAQLPEGAVGAVGPGAEVRFTVPAYPGREWSARIARVAPAIDPATRTLEVQAAVDDPRAELRAEMFATVRVQGPASEPVPVVPAAAVQVLDGDTVLIRAEQRGEGMHLRAVPVRIGRRTADAAEVLSGVEVGSWVVVDGAAVARAEIVRRRDAGSER